MKDVLLLLYNCGAISQSFVEKENIESKINELLEKKEIEREIITDKKGKELIVYKISEVGEKTLQLEFPEKKYFYRNFYVEKSLRLLDYYIELTDEEKETWQTKDEILTLLDDEKPLDAIYMSNGEKIGVYIMNPKVANKNLINTIEQTIKKLQVDNVHFLTF